MRSIVALVLLFVNIKANPFLDIYFHVHPLDDFCETAKCDVNYALSLLISQNQFDMQSVQLQEGVMQWNSKMSLEDSTVFRLNKDLLHSLDRVYLGLSLFDVPEEMQGMIVIDVTNTINKGRKTWAEFVSDSMRVKMHIYRRHEPTFVASDMASKDLVLSNGGLAPLQFLDHAVDNECTCKNNVCSCCRHLTIRKIRLDDVVCINATYVPDQVGFEMALAVGDQTPRVGKEIVVGNTLPICFEMTRKYGTLCIRLYGFERHDQKISFCLAVEARLYHVKVSQQKIDCLRVSVSK